jgi:hypothetical protein
MRSAILLIALLVAAASAQQWAGIVQYSGSSYVFFFVDSIRPRSFPVGPRPDPPSLPSVALMTPRSPFTLLSRSRPLVAPLPSETTPTRLTAPTLPTPRSATRAALTALLLPLLPLLLSPPDAPSSMYFTAPRLPLLFLVSDPDRFFFPCLQRPVLYLHHRLHHRLYHHQVLPRFLSFGLG